MDGGVLVMKGCLISNAKVVRGFTVAWCVSHGVCCMVHASWVCRFVCLACCVAYVALYILDATFCIYALHVACCTSHVAYSAAGCAVRGDRIIACCICQPGMHVVMRQGDSVRCILRT
jgi:hypothetical protein